MTVRRIAIIAAIANALLLAVIGWFVVRGSARDALEQNSSGWHGTAIDPPMPERPFSLESVDGPVALGDLRGDVVLLYFGYTRCPDVCPLTLAKVAQVRSALRPDDAASVRGVMISIDPERDSADRLARYVAQFDTTFIGLTGTRLQIEAIARDYGIYHDDGDAAAMTSASAPPGRNSSKTASADHASHAPARDTPLIAHTTHILVLDRAGRLALLWSTSVTAGQMADDLRRLLST